ncbi:MAG: DUF4105 domain-containing protein, partial [Muribaculaceae bacterium]|nr:DUF4105 domain-containing protein [Muribaculaceae bacterium]
VYNYGVFDFEQPNFVYRFVKGETDYRAAEQPYGPFMAHYAAHGRRAMAHRLNLSSQATARLVEMLRTNVRPENAVYRYNYVLDNCATRPLRIVELAIGDTILTGPAPIEANSAITPTFRNVMRHYHRNYPWYQFGIDLALGSGIDRPISSRQAAFAPAELDRMLPTARVGGRPLVLDSAPLIDTPAEGAVLAPTPWYLSPLAVCWAFFAVTLAVAVRDLRRHRLTRWFDSAVFAIFGLAGCLLTFLIFISVHEATSPNILYFWLNPLCLLVPILIWIKSARVVLICYQMINFAVLFALCAAWPFVAQSANPAFLPLVLADMILAIRFVTVARRPAHHI